MSEEYDVYATYEVRKYPKENLSHHIKINYDHVTDDNYLAMIMVRELMNYMTDKGVGDSNHMKVLMDKRYNTVKRLDELKGIQAVKELFEVERELMRLDDEIKIEEKKK